MSFYRRKRHYSSLIMWRREPYSGLPQCYKYAIAVALSAVPCLWAG